MAATPFFGGTNSVPELDAGQKGSARHTSKVQWVANVTEGPPEFRDVIAAMVEQNQIFASRLGWSGQIFTWSGPAVFENDTEVAALRSVLNQYRTGSTIDPTTGVMSAPNVAYLKGSILKDSFGKALASRAIVVDWRFGPRWRVPTGRTGFTRWNTITIVFRKLA